MIAPDESVTTQPIGTSPRRAAASASAKACNMGAGNSGIIGEEKPQNRCGVKMSEFEGERIAKVIARAASALGVMPSG